LILDTNALSAFVDGDAALAIVLRSARRAALPVIVLGEFRYGISRSRHRRTYEAWLAAHVPAFDVLDVSNATTLFYATVRTDLRRLGTPIPANDAWIAALALEHDLPVVSRDAHFDVVPGVVRHDY
jgi:predicted nucleic acid-binding protein